MNLGRYAFSEIGNAVVAPVLLQLQKLKPDTGSNLWGCRLNAPRPSEEQDSLLKEMVHSNRQPKINQSSFLSLPNTPLCYWIGQTLIAALSSGPYVEDAVEIRQGTQTANNLQFLRFSWEVRFDRDARWLNYAKGGGYGKWHGFTEYMVDWEARGARVKNYIVERYPYLNGNWGMVVRNEEYFGSDGATFTQMSNGSMGVRLMPAG